MWDIALSDWIKWLKTLPDNSIQMFVTSPPYWGLRDYGVKGQLGLEKTPELYINKIVAGFRELRRVLRPDGTLWLNMGDSYAGSGKGGNSEAITGRGKDASIVSKSKRIPRGSGRWGGGNNPAAWTSGSGKPRPTHTSGVPAPPGLKPKDMVGMPWRVALALQADGWWLRQDIIWSKPNPMPESVQDRCCKAHEYIFLLSKSERYYFDTEAIKEPSSIFSHARGEGVNPKARREGINSNMSTDRDPRHLEYERNRNNGVGWGTRGALDGIKAQRTKQNASFSAAVTEIVTERIKRSVWEIPTSPYAEAHFATFPPALVEPCILAGTSEKGCCAECRAPWERIMEVTTPASKTPSGWHQAEERKEGRDANTEYNGKHSLVPERTAGKRVLESMKRNREAGGYHDNPYPQKITVGWSPTCDCKTVAPPIPCTVADPFSGAGTSCLVSVRLGRSFKGSELNPEYRSMSIRRVEQDAPLFNLQSRGDGLHEIEQLVPLQHPLLPLPGDTAS